MSHAYINQIILYNVEHRGNWQLECIQWVCKKIINKEWCEIFAISSLDKYYKQSNQKFYNFC